MSDIPLMFQAAIPERGKIQYIGDKEKAYNWVEQWRKGLAPNVPQFPSNVCTKDYRIAWRFLTDSGQDNSVIRPVIGAKGYPFYPGASMKGGFKRLCTPEEALRFCGKDIRRNGSVETQPGILRFHGGYLKNAKPMDRSLVDLTHEQQGWQVKETEKHSANILISLYEPTFVFGMSSREELDEETWTRIWQIWEKAIARGIGSRTSAGYGSIKKRERSDRHLLSVQLIGQGVASKLLDETPEFRPNMFKATLRGHTLRLFGGATDEATAEALTKELWGGFAGQRSIVGLLAIDFNSPPGEPTLLNDYLYRNTSIPTYEFAEKPGVLNLQYTKPLSDEERKKLSLLTTRLIKFTLLLGGFGKSWRRVDHRLVFPEYTNRKQGNIHANPLIGCHWKFASSSEKLYVPIQELGDITAFLESLQTTILNWLKYKKKSAMENGTSWREAWHPGKVQVWGRIASCLADSQAVYWFHGSYAGQRRIKGTELTGYLNQIGRIWHRMYPQYITLPNGQFKSTGKYIELLTLFPDASENTEAFLKFLDEESEFTKIHSR